MSLQHFKLHLLLHHHFHVLLELNHHGIFWHLVEASFHLLHVWHNLLSMHVISGKVRIYSHHVWIIKRRTSRCTHDLFHITMSSITNISKLTCSYWTRLIPKSGIIESSLSWHSILYGTLSHGKHWRIKKLWSIVRNPVCWIWCHIRFFTISSNNQFWEWALFDCFIKIILIRYRYKILRFIEIKEFPFL